MEVVLLTQHVIIKSPVQRVGSTQTTAIGGTGNCHLVVLKRVRSLCFFIVLDILSLRGGEVSEKPYENFQNL